MTDYYFWMHFWFFSCCILTIIFLYSLWRLTLINAKLQAQCRALIEDREKNLKKREEILDELLRKKDKEDQIFRDTMLKSGK